MNSAPPEPGNNPELIAHRGFMGQAPQNTPVAFSLAVVDGADSLECDVSVSSDGVLYTFHDTTIDALTTGTGTFTALTSAYLDGVEIEEGIGTEYAPLRIGKFSEFLEIANANNRKIYPELKRLRSNADVAPIVQAVIDAGMDTRCNMSAFQLSRLQIVRGLSATIELGMLSDSSDSVELTSLVDSMITLGNASMIVNYTSTLANPSVVEYALANGIGWASYIVNDLETVEDLNAINVFRIISDFPMDLPEAP